VLSHFPTEFRAEIQALGVELICVPSSVHGAKDHETPMFTPVAVEWAMARVMKDLE
jgi:hypothetical protein